MKIGDKAAANRISYEIVEKMGEGGQGSVWKAKRTDNGVLYAVKIINEKDPDKRRNKLNNIKRLIENSLDSSLKAPCDEHGVKFAFPIAQINDAATGETGYVMELASGKTLDSLWREGTLLRMGTRDKLEIAYKVAKAIDILHSHGYCYTDISWANFMWDKQNRRLYIIDCENAACSAHIDSGECHFLIGTGFFIAPEVAFGKAKVGFNSDLYALATMIFCLLTGNVLFLYEKEISTTTGSISCSIPMTSVTVSIICAWEAKIQSISPSVKISTKSSAYGIIRTRNSKLFFTTHSAILSTARSDLWRTYGRPISKS